MLSLMIIIMIILSVLLIIAVLIQPGKGDMVSGLGSIGGTFTSMFGSRRAMDKLVKFTIGLSIGIILLSLITNKFFVNHETEGPKAVTEGVEVPSTVPPMSNMPGKMQKQQAPAQQAPAQQQPQGK